MQERHYLYPNVPTMKELNVNLDTGNWVGFIAPSVSERSSPSWIGRSKNPEESGGGQLLAEMGTS